MIPDNYDIWEAHDIEMERRRARRPVCECCGEHIQGDTAYLIHGDWYCEDCMDNYKELVEDYIDE
jgi:formylmethanofuran dehydrogenase subunit E